MIESFLAQLVLAAFAILGHTALWVTLLNRSHAFPLPCRLLKSFQLFTLLTIPAGVVGYFAWWWFTGDAAAPPIPLYTNLLDSMRRAITGLANPAHVSPFLAVYVYICWGCAVLTVVIWAHRQFVRGVPAALLSNHTISLDVTAELGKPPISGRSTELLMRVPGNQSLRLDVNEKRLVIERLPAALDGVSIAHISDLHYTGKLTEEFYNLVVDRTNALGADLIAVTGDILDRMFCVDWIAPTLGRLHAPCGVYFVLGNHDKRLRDPAAIRAAMVATGMVDVSGGWHEVPCRGSTILLAGNEHPWFGPRPRAEDRPDHAGKEENEEPPFSVLLTHTPDQIGWARRHGFDLVLAGHNHGGQIRFPLLGPIVSPSVYGVRYASGLFHEPPCLMHVSRGVAGEKLLRINCPPEITKLVLRTPVARTNS